MEELLYDEAEQRGDPRGDTPAMLRASSVIVVDGTTGMAVGEHVRIGTTEVLVAQVVDGTEFDIEIPLAQAPSAGLTVYRGWRGTITFGESVTIEAVSKAFCWVFATLGGQSDREAWFYGEMDAFAAPVVV